VRVDAVLNGLLVGVRGLDIMGSCKVRHVDGSMPHTAAI
jgi:hypothetical protein